MSSGFYLIREIVFFKLWMTTTEIYLDKSFDAALNANIRGLPDDYIKQRDIHFIACASINQV